MEETSDTPATSLPESPALPETLRPELAPHVEAVRSAAARTAGDPRDLAILALRGSTPADAPPRLRELENVFRLDRPDGVDEAAAFRGALANELRAAGWPWREALDRARKAIPDPPADDGGDGGDGEPLISLADLDIDDSLPEWCGWLIGCPGRLVLLHGRWKGGKSTFMEGGVAAITRGREWLGRATKAGSVLLCTEMHAGDVKRTLRQFDADLTRVYVCRPEELSEHVQRAPDDLVLVVVDTLTTYAEAIGITKLSDPITAKKLMMTLRRAVFGSRPEVSLHVQHHNRKAPAGVDEAEARDSTAIMGDADQVISMLDGEKGDPPTIRRLRATGRWSEPGATVRLAGDGFEIVSTDDPLDTDPTGGGGGSSRFDRTAVVEYVMREAPSAEGAALTLNQIQTGMEATSRPARAEIKRIVQGAELDGELTKADVRRGGQRRDGFRASGSIVRHCSDDRNNAPAEHPASGTAYVLAVPVAGCSATPESDEHCSDGRNNAQAFDPGGAFLALCTACHAVRCKAGDVLCVNCRKATTDTTEFRRPGDWELRISPAGQRPRVARFPDGHVVVPFGPPGEWEVVDVASA